jgi:ABC-type sugar transport system ATPase subunit
MPELDSVEGTSTAPPAPPLLEMRGIRKSFTGDEVLHGVDFTLEHGQIHALVGQNGAGKSTLMKILGGSYDDYTGEIRIAGAACHPSSPHEALGMGVAVIYQEFALAPNLSVADNIALGREPRGRLPGSISRRRMLERSQREADALGIRLPMKQAVGRLSVGDQQLTEIVKALSRNARLLVMDEPTARLSTRERDRLFDIIRALSAQGVGVVYISHFLEEVFAVAHHVTVLRDGQVVGSRSTTSFDMAGLTTLMVGTALRQTSRPDRIPSPAQPVLELVDLSVLSRPPLSLTLGSGEILGVAGLVGSGRSRLGKAIVGSAQSAGTIRIDGQARRIRTPQEGVDLGVVYLPEDRKQTGLILPLTVASNLVLTALQRGLSHLGFVRQRARRDEAAALIERFRILPPDPRRLVNTLSGGNQQKVLLARSLAAKARVIILDQPTAGVDVGAKAEIYHQIWEMSKAGIGQIVISDDLDELLLLADRILVMHGGRAAGMLEVASLSRPELLQAITTGRLAAAA